MVAFDMEINRANIARLHVSPSPPHFQSRNVHSPPLNRNIVLFSLRCKMPREAEISINEREFISQALKEQIRLDGRAFDAFRNIELTFGEDYGVADVQHIPFYGVDVRTYSSFQCNACHPGYVQRGKRLMRIKKHAQYGIISYLSLPSLTSLS